MWWGTHLIQHLGGRGTSEMAQQVQAPAARTDHLSSPLWMGPCGGRRELTHTDPLTSCALMHMRTHTIVFIIIICGIEEIFLNQRILCLKCWSNFSKLIIIAESSWVYIMWKIAVTICAWLQMWKKKFVDTHRKRFINCFPVRRELEVILLKTFPIISYSGINIMTPGVPCTYVCVRIKLVY